MIEATREVSPEIVASHYDDLDSLYREIWGLHLHHGFWKKGNESSSEATEALLEHLIRDVEFSANSHVCDVGCGYGETARYLADRFGVKVTGLSISENQINFGKTVKNNSLVELIHRDWMNNQLSSNAFDLVLSIESSEHMPDIRKFFNEAHRVLRPGGKLKICAWLSKISPTEKELKYLLRPICDEGRLHLCDETEYRDFIKDAGFREHHFEDITDNVKKTWSICIQRCAWKFLSDPKFINFFLKGTSKNKKFILSLLRIRLAYETRSMVYGIFTAIK